MKLDVNSFYKVVFEEFDKSKEQAIVLGNVSILDCKDSVELAEKLLKDKTWDKNEKLNPQDRFHDFHPTLLMVASYCCAHSVESFKIFKLLVRDESISKILDDDLGDTLWDYIDRAVQEIDDDIHVDIENGDTDEVSRMVEVKRFLKFYKSRYMFHYI